MDVTMLGTEILYTAVQTRALDRCAIEQYSIPGFTLMSRAAATAYTYLIENWPHPSQLQVLCGTGNNGGDGFLIADLAKKRGLPVNVLQVGDPQTISGDAKLAQQQALANGVKMVSFGDVGLAPDGIIVDALLGTGLAGEVREAYAEAIAVVNASGLPVLAVDIPSGLCADTGQVLGTAIRADLTVTFIGLKRGLFTGHAADHTGVVHYCDLAVPHEIFESVPSDCSRLELEVLLERLLPRPAIAHKGDYGTVLIVGGDYGMAGAAAMASEAALRCGAGLVRVATHPEHVAALIARMPEAMCSSVRSQDDFLPLLDAADILVVGPGLGQSAWSQHLLQQALASGKPAVLDADALNMLAAGSVDESGMHEGMVLTPHPGEAARLLGISTAEVQADRFAAAAALQQRYSAVVILKGNGSLVRSEGQTLVCDYGNPGMASGGMGDVLSGVIGALLAQHLEPLEAAALAVCLHGAAGDIAAADGERGLLATDLIAPMRLLLG